MLRKPLLTFLAALLLVGLLVTALARLFALRYEVGDIYPEYSSLRADPLGTKALAEALEELPNVEVRRNFQPLPKMRAETPVTLIYTGVPHRAFWSDKELLAFDALVARGSRAVFTFFPVESPLSEHDEKLTDKEEMEKKRERIEKERDAAEKKRKEAQKKSNGQKTKNAKGDEKSETDRKKDEADSRLIPFQAVAKRWGFDFGYLPPEKEEFQRHAALVEPGGKLEPDLTWHSALYFRDLKPHWKVLYMCGTMPVVIERKYGDGSIVLVADSFLVSNEALRGERHPRFLARLFSGPSTIVFDEESRGLLENPGIAGLARKYRLHGVVAGLLLLAILFVWKNVVRFIPAYTTPASESSVIAGKESSEGFTNLLRRAIRPSAIFEACLAEWIKVSAHRPRDLAQVEEIWAQERARPARARDPIATYRAISQTLHRR